MSTAPASQPEISEQTLRIAGMSCAACQTHVQRALSAVPGVQEAFVDLLANKAHVTGDATVTPAVLSAAVRHAGYDVLSPSTTLDEGGSATSNSATTEDTEGQPGQRHLGLRALLALISGALAMVLSMPLMSSGAGARGDVLNDRLMRWSAPLLPAWLLTLSPNLLRGTLFALALTAMLFAAPEIYGAAWRAARHRATNMNTLVALGTLVAFASSTYTSITLFIGRSSANFSDVYFEAVVLILAFLLAGRWLEGRARHRATASLRAFAHIEAGDARWIAEGFPVELETNPGALLSAPETLLPLDAIAVGDILRVLPGDRVPLDGVVLAGASSVDESMLTGEPLPATRAAGDRLFSGTLNLDGPLLFRATALGADSMQAQMARLLERARSTRAPLQRVADRVSAVFVPVVLALAALTFAVWGAVDNSGAAHLGYARALSLAIAVLVVACPCAMGLAVPAAVAVSLGTGARAGILIKGGEALERLASVDTIALDKTGTLTEGKPHIAAFRREVSSSIETATLLAWAVAVEAASTHPLADALRSYAHTQPVAAAGQTSLARVLPGLGAEAMVDGHHLVLGNAALLPSGIPLPVPPTGLEHATPMYLLVDGALQATFYATDTLRASAAPALGSLRGLGLTATLLTGDTDASAQAVAHELGIGHVQAKLLPADKVAAITALRREGHKVAMVGDGLNDAAALAHADAGIAMASGTDLAREAGHVLLLQHDLRLVPLAIRLARRTRRLMRQNLGWAMLYNVLGIPLAAGILLPRFGIALSPALASAAMALSSVSVLLNSLRLARPLR